MSDIQKNNKFQGLLISLLAFFIFVFFTANIYGSLQENLDINNSNIEKLEKLDTKLIELNNFKTSLSDKNNDNFKKIKKFNWDFSEDKLIFYINDYIEQVNDAEKDIVLFLDDISFSEEKKSELWFKEIEIDLKLSKIRDKAVLNNLLDYLVSEDNNYSFFITDFSFDIEESWPYKVNIPLKMYVK